MKTNRLLTLALFTFAISTSLFAQTYERIFTTEQYQKIVDRRFVPSLKSNVQGITEGAIYNLAVCRQLLPELDFSKAQKALDAVVADHESPVMRYKAHLVLLYLQNADHIAITPVRGSDSYEYLFREISQELQKTMLMAANAGNAN